MRVKEGRGDSVSGRSAGNSITESGRLFVLTLPVVIWYGLFCYLPMFGVFFAFKDFTPKPGQSLF